MITKLTDSAVVEMFDAQPHVGEEQLPITPSPQDWRDTWIYFLLVDRFNNPTKKPASTDPSFGGYQGGTFAGIREKLPYLKNLGVGAIWLSPVLMNPQWFDSYWGGYGIMDFVRVEPRFCDNPNKALADPKVGDEEFRLLVDAIHAEGMYVIMDIVLNHTGNLFDYEGMQNTPPYNNDREYDVYWRNAKGVPQGDRPMIENVANLKPEEGVWPAEFQKNSFFRRRGEKNDQVGPLYGDFDGMRELATELREPGTDIYPVRNALIRAYQYLIGRFDIDGYRIDTFKHVETAFARTFGNAIREYALSIGKKNFLTFGEVASGCNEQDIADRVGGSGDMMGVDAAIDFPMNEKILAYVKCNEPAANVAAQFQTRKEVWGKVVSSHGDASRYYVTFLDSHDKHERITVPGWERQTDIALTILMTIQGIPTVYYGTELGLTGHGSQLENVREALWGQTGAFTDTHPSFALIKRLHDLRLETPALRYGRQYFRQCSGDGITFNYSEYNGGILAFSRILNDTEILTVANSSTTTTTTVYVTVDHNLHSDDTEWECVLASDGVTPQPRRTETHNGNRTVQVTLPPMTAQILARKR